MSGLSSLGVPGVPWHTQILENQLTLFQTGGTDYAHLITSGTPGFSDLPTTALSYALFFSDSGLINQENYIWTLIKMVLQALRLTYTVMN